MAMFLALTWGPSSRWFLHWRMMGSLVRNLWTIVNFNKMNCQTVRDFLLSQQQAIAQVVGLLQDVVPQHPMTPAQSQDWASLRATFKRAETSVTNAITTLLNKPTWSHLANTPMFETAPLPVLDADQVPDFDLLLDKDDLLEAKETEDKATSPGAPSSPTE